MSSGLSIQNAHVSYGRRQIVHDLSLPTLAHGSLTALIEGLYPERWDTLRPINAKELNATSVLRIPLTEASAKVRDSGVKDDDEDLGWPVWAGVIPLRTTLGTPSRDAESVGQTVPATRFDADSPLA